jgi:hypothetical protein
MSSLHFLPTADKATLEAAHMSKIAPPRPATIQEMEERELAACHQALVGRPVRIEVKLDSIMQCRNDLIQTRDSIDRAIMLLTDHIQNPPPNVGRDAIKDWVVLHQVKSVLASVRALTSSRFGTRKSRAEKSK